MVGLLGNFFFTSSSSGHATFAASNGWPYATSGAPKPNANKKVAF